MLKIIILVLGTFQHTHVHCYDFGSTKLSANNQYHTNQPTNKPLKPKKDYSKTIAVNRQARRNFEITQTLEVGLSLKGTEVKSIRSGTIQLRDAYVKCDPRTGQCLLHNVNIARHGHSGSWAQHDETRVRRLLMHKSEGRKFGAMAEVKGCTVVVLKAYFNRDNRVKLEVGAGKGKNLHDKRDDIKDRDAKRDTMRQIKDFR